MTNIGFTQSGELAAAAPQAAPVPQAAPALDGVPAADDVPPLPAPPTWTWWDHVLDLLLTLWVLRAAVGGLVLGALILWLAPQAQDLLVELATDTYGQWIKFFLLLALVWALPTHYASRLLLNTDDRYLARLYARNTAFLCWLRLWTPRLLGTLTFVIVAVATIRSWSNVPTVSDADFVHRIGVNLAWVAAASVIIGALFLWYTISRQYFAAWVDWLEKFTKRLAVVIRLKYHQLKQRLRRGNKSIVGEESDQSGGDGPVNSVLGPVLLVVMTIVFVGGPLVWPLPFAEIFPRSAAVPFVVGGWIPLLSFFASKGRVHRFPWIATAFAIVSVLPAFVGNNYAVRRIAAAPQVAALLPKTEPETLKTITPGFTFIEAVQWWKKANGVDCVADSKKCPRPIIVAAAGGASRAGFFTASVLGQLLDDALKVDGKGHNLKPADVKNRLFALSSVSGSSVGTVMTVAALAAAKKDGAQACTAKTDPLWFGEFQQREIADWRSCLEALMAGDFLTPVFDGFVFRDMLRILHVVTDVFGRKLDDRASLLEQAWEAQFESLVGAVTGDPKGLPCWRSLECPLMTLRPSADRWLPLLLLNGTSVGTGQRIMTSALARQYELDGGKPCPLEPRKTGCSLFLDTQSFHELLGGERTKLNDVRLSTAAHNSARFPVISPPGEVFNDSGVIVDRIVDGGYFENFGALTAGEVVRALRAVDIGLDPFVLVLSNDPQVREIDPKAGSQPATAPVQPASTGAVKTPPAGQEGNALTDALGPVDAIMNARNAHGIVAVDGLASLLDNGRAKGACNVVTIKVWGEPSSSDPDKLRQLSMSWWLSKPVQMYLHDQTDFSDPGKMQQNRNVGNVEAARAVLMAMQGRVEDGAVVPKCPR